MVCVCEFRDLCPRLSSRGSFSESRRNGIWARDRRGLQATDDAVYVPLYNLLLVTSSTTAISSKNQRQQAKTTFQQLITARESDGSIVSALLLSFFC